MELAEGLTASDKYTVLMGNHSEWFSDEHDYAKIVSLNVSRDVDRHGPGPYDKGTVKVATDNGCFLTFKLWEFLVGWSPFVRPSAWDRILD